MDMPEGLDNKIGPLPVWVWGLALGGVIVVWMYVKKSSPSSTQTVGTAADTSQLATDTASLGSSYPIDPLSASSNYGFQAGPDTMNNQTWEAAAIGSADTFGLKPLGVQSAVDKYLNGETLNSAEQSAIDKILGVLGPPPESILGSVNGDVSILQPAAPTPAPTSRTTTKATPKPKPKAAPKPKPQPKPQPVMYHIKSGDTLSQIAQRYGTSVNAIQKLNPSQIRNPNLIYAGNTIRVK